MDDPDHEQDLRSFGRRRGRAPSARQKALWHDVLPRVAVPRDAEALRRLPDLFAPPVSEVWLEIGFGGAEHLLWQARQHPGIGLVGCEPFQDGVIKALSSIEAEALANIRLWPDDARPLLRLFPEACLGRAFILFPDPWPKKRHHKRRLIAAPTLADLARAMVRGAELRIATDIPAYACAILRSVQEEGSFGWTAAGPDDWRRRPPDWPQTRYEAKALRQDRRCYYLRFARL